jgi:uncharacterized tellurite resistance protein B-like protein
MPESNIQESPLEDRAAYATIVASMAAADDVLSAVELRKLEELCRALDLPGESSQAVTQSAKTHDAGAVAAALARLCESDLRFTLFADCLRLAYVDDGVLPSEERALREVAAELRIADEQVEALRRTVEAERGTEGTSKAADTVKELAAVGIPASAVALASAAGLSSAGIGVAATGLGMATGIGAVVGLGIGTVLAVRWLHHRLARSRTNDEKAFEYMHQGSTLTLAQGFEQFHASIPGLVGEKPLSSEQAAELFRLHDHCHVVFGCDTSLGNEGLVDTWSLFGTDVAVAEYVEYTKIPEAKELFDQVGYMRGLLESIRTSPKLFEVFLRARAMIKKWPFHEGPEKYRDWRLVDIRNEFGIEVL